MVGAADGSLVVGEAVGLLVVPVLDVPLVIGAAVGALAVDVGPFVVVPMLDCLSWARPFHRKCDYSKLMSNHLMLACQIISNIK